MTLPAEVSAQLFKELGPEEVQAITMEISKLPQVSPEVRSQVIEEFLHSTNAGGGGIDLGAAMGAASSAIGSSGGGLGLGGSTMMSGGGAPAFGPPAAPSNKPLGFLRRVEVRQVLALIRREHPQTIAVVLSYLDPQQASSVLGELSQGVQTEVARRLAELGAISSDIVKQLESYLERRLQQALEQGFDGRVDGKETLLEILNQADRNTEERVLSGLTQKSPHLASDIKTKLCDFEDLNNIDDSSLQQVLRLTDFRDLVFALKGANRDLAERIYKFLSPEVAKGLRDDVENLGQVDWEDIKSAQQQIRNILRGLVTLGKIRFR